MSLRLCRNALSMLTVLCVLLSAGASHAGQTVDWKTLLPPLPPLHNPLGHLTQEQRLDIDTIAWARALDPEERRLMASFSKRGLDDAAIQERRLREAGFNVDQLVEDYRAWQLARAERQELVNKELDQKKVKIAGYLLPLEFSEKGEKDFLLVPYVGACIHVPPPPQNQIVFVRLAKEFQVQDLYTPVWVTGTMLARASTRKLSLSDGSRGISVGYHLENGSVEIFKENVAR